MASWHHVTTCLINLKVVSKKEITVTVLLETKIFMTRNNAILNLTYSHTHLIGNETYLKRFC